MAVICCACGKRVGEGEKYYKLNKDTPDEFLCAACVTHLQGMSRAAKAGDAQFLPARRAFIDILNRGAVSDKAADYFDGYLDYLNRSYDAAAPAQARADYAPPAQASYAPAPPVYELTPRPPAVAETASCPQCGAENIADSAFCELCGAQIKPTKYCRFCGGRVSLVTGYCEACGRNSRGEKQARGFSAEALRRKADTVGQSIRSTASQTGAGAGGQDIYPFIAAGIALILALFIFGKMFRVTMPVMSFFSEGTTSYTFSLLNISRVANSFQELAYMFDLGDAVRAFKTVSTVILALVIAMLLLYVWVIVSLFVKRRSVFKWLGVVGKAMSILLLLLTVFVIVLNSAIKKELGDFDMLLTVTPTALLYIALILNAVVGFWLYRFLERRSAGGAAAVGGGYARPGRIVCPRCGGEMDAQQRFCIYCGTPLG